MCTEYFCLCPIVIGVYRVLLFVSDSYGCAQSTSVCV